MTDTQHDEDRIPVVVIGAGLAGLSAAVHLANGGVPPLVLEADSRWPGGRLSAGDPDTFTFAGQNWAFTPEQGMHALWGGYVNMKAMIARFTDTQLRPSRGEEWINRWGREVRRVEAGNAVRSAFIPAPFHYWQLLFHRRFWGTINPFDFLSLPGFLSSILWTTGFDPLKEQVPLDGLMMQEYFRGWTPNLRATLTGVGVNMLAAHPDDIDAASFIAAMRFYTMLRRDSWHMAYMPDNANNALIQPLIRSITDHDGMFMEGVTAQCLRRDGNGWRLVVQDERRGGSRSVSAERIILAVDSLAAERLLTAGADTAQSAAGIRFHRAVRNSVVRMWFSTQPHASADAGMFTGDFVPDNFFWLDRLYPEFSGWHAQGYSALEVHIYGTEDFLDQPERNQLIVAVDEVQRAWPELKGHFIHGAVRRNTRTQTVFRIPTERDSLFVDTPWDGIYACGDWIGFDTPSFWMERATVTGIAAANHVLEGRGLTPYPILQPLPPEPLARVLGGIVRGGRATFGPPLTLLKHALHR